MFYSINDIKERIEAIPCLRKIKHFSPESEIILCHINELSHAQAFYKNQLNYVPEIITIDNASSHILNMDSQTSKKQIHVFCLPASAPFKTYFVLLSNYLHQSGIAEYNIEPYSADQFWRYGKTYKYSDLEYQTIQKICNALADEESQLIFLAACKSRQRGDPGYIPRAGYPQYQHPYMQVKPGDIVCEGGVDDGRSTIRLAEQVGKSGRIHAFEPVAASYKKCLQTFLDYPQIKLTCCALWSSTGTVNFFSQSDTANSSHIVQNSQHGTDIVNCVSIDDYFNGTPVNCIKLDVEGAEYDVLEGAKETITNSLPQLMISIYHNSGADLLNLPSYIVTNYPEYQLYCGHHSRWYNETMLYCTINNSLINQDIKQCEK